MDRRGDADPDRDDRTLHRAVDSGRLACWCGEVRPPDAQQERAYQRNDRRGDPSLPSHGRGFSGLWPATSAFVSALTNAHVERRITVPSSASSAVVEMPRTMRLTTMRPNDGQPTHTRIGSR